jgi:hypothetical protein
MNETVNPKPQNVFYWCYGSIDGQSNPFFSLPTLDPFELWLSRTFLTLDNLTAMKG